MSFFEFAFQKLNELFQRIVTTVEGCSIQTKFVSQQQV